MFGRFNNISYKPEVYTRANPNDKYYLVLTSVFKNEGVNMIAFIEHYLWQGVDHIYLVD